MLTRADLENDALRRQAATEHPEVPLLSEAEFQASLERVLAGHAPDEDCWVFAYGSLIWNPLFEHDARELAVIHGFHRAFCLWSRLGRGSPDRPGLMLGLDRGGRCHGVVFRIAAERVREELTLLWRREMPMGSYAPRWTKTRIGTRTHRALAFVVNHDSPNYAGRLPTETIVETLATTRGRFGAGWEYLFQTVECLHSHGLHDARLEHLRARVHDRLRRAEA